MEQVFRSLKTGWAPTASYMICWQAQLGSSHYLMHFCNRIRPHLVYDGVAPAKTEEKLKTVSGESWPLNHNGSSHIIVTAAGLAL